MDKIPCCFGKDKMERGTAWKVAENMAKQKKYVNVYKCPICKTYHVGRCKNE